MFPYRPVHAAVQEHLYVLRQEQEARYAKAMVLSRICGRKLGAAAVCAAVAAAACVSHAAMDV